MAAWDGASNVTPTTPLPPVAPTEAPTPATAAPPPPPTDHAHSPVTHRPALMAGIIFGVLAALMLVVAVVKFLRRGRLTDGERVALLGEGGSVTQVNGTTLPEHSSGGSTDDFSRRSSHDGSQRGGTVPLQLNDAEATVVASRSSSNAGVTGGPSTRASGRRSSSGGAILAPEDDPDVAVFRLRQPQLPEIHREVPHQWNIHPPTYTGQESPQPRKSALRRTVPVGSINGTPPPAALTAASLAMADGTEASTNGGLPVPPAGPGSRTASPSSRQRTPTASPSRTHRRRNSGGSDRFGRTFRRPAPAGAASTGAPSGSPSAVSPGRRMSM